MKKKIFLAVMLIAMLGCLFAISVSAADLAYDRVYTINGTEYPLWEMDADGNYHPLMWYQDGDKLSKVWADNTDRANAPYVAYSAYLSGTSREIQNFNITDANGNVFNGKETVVIANLHNIYLKAGDNSQITHIHKNAFNSSTVLKAVYIPESIVYVGWTNNDGLVPFQNCTSLEYAEFAPSSSITSIDCNSFFNCSALKAISLPDSVTKINHSTFSGCTSLEAVYLPSSLETFVYHSWNKGAFYNCPKLYFVNEPFTVDNIASDIPSKPEVYYFPSDLSALGDSFRACTSINNTLVFGENLLVVDNTVFTGTGAKGEAKTAVFTGQLTKFYLGEGIDPTWSFVFTNTTDESVFSTRTDRAFGNSYGYLCKTNRKCLFNYGVKWEDGTTHFVDAKETQTVDATCTENKLETTYCYCGTQMSSAEAGNTALGHAHNVFVDLVYENYSADGYYSYKCERCDSLNNEQIAPALFKKLGYSAAEYGDAQISLNYRANEQAIAEYEEIMGVSISYGIFAVLAESIGNNDVFDASGKAHTGAVTADITNSGFKFFSLKMFGFTDEQKGIGLAMGAFVGTTLDGTTEYSYLQIAAPTEGEKYFFASYNDVVALLPVDEDTVS